MTDRLTAVSWELAPHTAAKLDILGAYLRAWFPILGRGQNFDRIIYVDGFAGPGRYKKGEDGSPIIALKAAVGALASRQINKPFEFHFVERKRRVAAALKANIENLKQQTAVPSNVEIFVHERLTFEQAYQRHIRTRLQAHPRAPAFALVDPFGWTGIPITILSELIKRQSTEILVNFMFEEINRFLAHPDQGQNFDALFGCAEWRKADKLAGQTRNRFIHDLYREQLRAVAGARFVRSFEMRNERDACDYFLYFASNNRLGLAKMKEAMWKVDRAGGFVFSDATNFDQAVLFQPEPDRHLLRRLISERFSNRRATVQQVENYVVDDTAFHAGHYRKVLQAIEADGGLTYLQPPPGRRRGTFADKSAVLDFQ